MPFTNLTFAQSAGTPAKIYGTFTPVATVLGATTLSFHVQGVLVTVDVDLGDTSVGALDALLSPHGVSVSEDSSVILFSTQEVGETASLAVVPTLCSENFGLYGEATGESYRPSPLGWTFSSFDANVVGFSKLLFDGSYDPNVESFGISEALKTGGILEISTGERVETFGGWPPGGLFFMQTGSFIGLEFANPSDIDIADGGSIDAPAGYPGPSTDAVMTQSNWYTPDFDSAFTPLVFSPGATELETFATIDTDPEDTATFSFGKSGYNLSAFEVFAYTLQGDLVITCNDGVAATVALTLQHEDMGSGVVDTALSGNLSYTIPASLQNGTGASVAALLVGKMRENPTIHAYQFSPSQLGYSGDIASRMVVVFSADPTATRVTTAAVSGNITTRPNIFDHSVSPINGLPVIPEIHFIRRDRFGYL